ncbi:MAG: Lrp/AsnC family transcriptional regulator [Alphaproteobacteria bacterium]
MTEHLDELDQRLISALRDDGRAAHASLAAQLNVTRATIKARLARMEARGVILGYRVQLASDTLRPNVRALTHIKILGHRTDRVIQRLKGVHWIKSIHTTNGRWDLIAELAAVTNRELDQALLAIREIEDIAESETAILLNEIA